MEGISGTDNIAELWRQHYNVLFNTVKSDVYNVGSIASNELVGVTKLQPSTLNSLVRGFFLFFQSVSQAS